MTKNAPTAAAGRYATALLALGAAIGFGAAAASLISIGGTELPDGALAQVNGVAIRTADYERAVTALASDRRNPLSDADRRHVLDRLVDEELLVQYGLALGLQRRDRRVRADIVSAVMGSMLASVDGYEPSRGEIESFYDANRDYFTRPGRIRVHQVFIGVGSRRSEDAARALAKQATRALRSSAPIETVRRDLGDVEIAPLPDTMLPATKLRNYLGPTVARAAAELEVGATSEPIRSAQGYHVLQLVARDDPELPPLDAIENETRAELKRRRGDEAVRDRLGDLRLAGDVTVATELP